MISPESIQQVTNRADIVEIIGLFVKLNKRGANYIANCPFHNEKTPSFNVNPAKGIFKCFGCGKGGDVVTFVEEYEKFSFVEAIRWLAKYYHIALEETEVSEEFKEQQQVEESLRIINEFATQYFQDVLNKEEEGQLIGKSYFQERGFRKHIIEDFRLGYCLDKWDSLTQTALAKGFSLDLLQKSGLVKSGSNGKPYDNYKGRVIFPIFSATGRIVGFGARTLKKDPKTPKYVNTPENELYIKNKVLYGLYQSRQSISKENECLLVEGYTDVLALHQGGITNVVSSSGTSLTEGQLKLIGNLTKNLTILYDGDAAGIKAALRGLDMALAESFNVNLVLLPNGEDPDSFIKLNGSEKVKTYIKDNKRDVVGFRLEVGLKEVGNDPILKSRLVNEIAETISKINKTEDFTLQQHYIRESANKLNIDEEGLINLVNKFIRERAQQDYRFKEREEKKLQDLETKADPETEQARLFNKDENKEEWQLLKLLLEFGDQKYKDEGLVAEVLLEVIDMESLEDEKVKRIFTEYANLYFTKGTIPDIKQFINHRDKEIKQKLAGLLQDPIRPSHNWKDIVKIDVLYGEHLYQQEVESSLAYFELKLINKLLIQNLNQLKEVRDTDEIIKLINAHKQLKEREKELMGIVIVK